MPPHTDNCFYCSRWRHSRSIPPEGPAAQRNPADMGPQDELPFNRANNCFYCLGTRNCSLSSAAPAAPLECIDDFSRQSQTELDSGRELLELPFNQANDRFYRLGTGNCTFLSAVPAACRGGRVGVFLPYRDPPNLPANIPLPSLMIIRLLSSRSGTHS